MKVQNFSLSTAHKMLHQSCTLIDSFCWKYIKFKLKSKEKLCLMILWIVIQNSKKNWSIVSKMTRIWWNLTWALKIIKISALIGFFCAKYITFDLKKCRGATSHDTEEWCKIWRKTNSGLENDMKNMVSFHKSTWKSQNDNFDGILLSKVEKVGA